MEFKTKLNNILLEYDDGLRSPPSNFHSILSNYKEEHTTRPNISESVSVKKFRLVKQAEAFTFLNSNTERARITNTNSTNNIIFSGYDLGAVNKSGIGVKNINLNQFKSNTNRGSNINNNTNSNFSYLTTTRTQINSNNINNNLIISKSRPPKYKQNKESHSKDFTILTSKITNKPISSSINNNTNLSSLSFEIGFKSNQNNINKNINKKVDNSNSNSNINLVSRLDSFDNLENFNNDLPTSREKEKEDDSFFNTSKISNVVISSNHTRNRSLNNLNNHSNTILNNMMNKSVLFKEKDKLVTRISHKSYNHNININNTDTNIITNINKGSQNYKASSLSKKELITIPSNRVKLDKLYGADSIEDFISQRQISTSKSMSKIGILTKDIKRRINDTNNAYNAFTDFNEFNITKNGMSSILLNTGEENFNSTCNNNNFINFDNSKFLTKNESSSHFNNNSGNGNNNNNTNTKNNNNNTHRNNFLTTNKNILKNTNTNNNNTNNNINTTTSNNIFRTSNINSTNYNKNSEKIIGSNIQAYKISSKINTLKNEIKNIGILKSNQIISNLDSNFNTKEKTSNVSFSTSGFLSNSKSKLNTAEKERVFNPYLTFKNFKL